MLSIGLCVATLIAVIAMMFDRGAATDGPIAVDNFRWMADIIILLGTIGVLIFEWYIYNRRVYL